MFIFNGWGDIIVSSESNNTSVRRVKLRREKLSSTTVVLEWFILPKYLHNWRFIYVILRAYHIGRSSVCESKLLSFFLPSNRTICARYVPYTSSANEPSVWGGYGKFSVGTLLQSWSQEHLTDYVLESIEKKALKTSGGIIGLTYQDNVLTRLFLSRPLTVKYPVNVKQRLNQAEESCRHCTDTELYKKPYNEDVKKMVGHFDETFVDSFIHLH